MEFLAGQLTFLGVGLTFTAHGTTYPAVGPVLCTDPADAADDFIFKAGTFSLHDPTEREASPIALPSLPSSR